MVNTTPKENIDRKVTTEGAKTLGSNISLGESLINPQWKDCLFGKVSFIPATFFVGGFFSFLAFLYLMFKVKKDKEIREDFI
jgi:hypothetical protein